KAPLAAHRRARRARQVEEAHSRAVGKGCAQADRRRHHFRRHDPEGRDPHLCPGTGRAGCRHHRRQDSTCGIAGAVHESGYRHADPQVTGSKAKAPKIRRSFRARMRRYTRRTALALPAAAVSLFVSSAPALADMKLCNRMSYVIEAAIGIDEKSATATRGWFRIDPAGCRVVVQGTLAADRI